MSDYCFACNSLGTVECLCGGDLCVCMNFGEKVCPDCGGWWLTGGDWEPIEAPAEESGER